MSDHDDLTNADVMTPAEMHEYDQASEAQLDAQDEERYAAEIAAEDQYDDGEPWEGLADGEER